MMRMLEAVAGEFHLMAYQNIEFDEYYFFDQDIQGNKMQISKSMCWKIYYIIID